MTTDDEGGKGPPARNRRILAVFLIMNMLLTALAGLAMIAGPTAMTTGSSLEVKPPFTSGIETFDSVPTGTNSGTISTSVGNLTILNPSTSTEVVALGDQLVSFTTASLPDSKVMTFIPDPLGNQWSMSSEVYPSKDYDMWHEDGLPASTNILYMNLESDGAFVARVALQVGDPSAGYENVRVYSAANSTWWTVLNDILPGHSNRHDPTPNDIHSQEGIYGDQIDHYIVEYCYSGAPSVAINIYHSTYGSVSLLTTQTVTLSGTIVSPTMSYSVQTNIVTNGVNPVLTAWFIDNLRVANPGDRCPVVSPVYEYVFEGTAAYLNVRGLDNSPITDADVTIGGVPATYVPAKQRYEAVLDHSVDWGVDTDYSVTVDHCAVQGRFEVTTMAATDHGISLPEWWNGWKWVSVAGVDDMSLQDAIDVYSAYDMPVTSYMIGTSEQADLWLTQSEAAAHYPHILYKQQSALWTTAISWAEQGMSVMDDSYDYASIWDDPSYVGVGDTYIMKACPENRASFDMLYAMYDEGFRTMGRSSDAMSAVSDVLYGAFWAWGHYGDNGTVNNTYPYEPLQLMNVARNPDLESSTACWDNVMYEASIGNVVSFYTHGIISSANAAMMAWVDDPKTNFTYENWKSTNGEVASYINGRWTTDVTYDPALSGDNYRTFDVSRQSPYNAGYWNVPVTLAFDLAQLHGLDDVVITEGSRTLKMSDGTLKDLDGARIMDAGYDIRNDTLYVSYFWNASSRLSILGSGAELPYAEIEPWAPQFTSQPNASGQVGSAYSYHAASNESVIFKGIAKPSWLHWNFANSTFSGTPSEAGTYSVQLRADSPGGLPAYQNWTIIVAAAPSGDGGGDQNPDGSGGGDGPGAGSDNGGVIKLPSLSSLQYLLLILGILGLGAVVLFAKRQRR